MLAAAAGQPQPRDYATPAWLLSATGDNASPTHAADAKCRRSAHPIGLLWSTKEIAHRTSARQLGRRPDDFQMRTPNPRFKAYAGGGAQPLGQKYRALATWSVARAGSRQTAWALSVDAPFQDHQRRQVDD
jgi:hypothetical protein